jgi:hypothetical protein
MSGYAHGWDHEGLFDALLLCAKKKVKYPYAQFAGRDDLEAIAELGCKTFGEYAFSVEKFRSLHRVNPKILLIVKDKKSGLIKGYLDIMPLKADFVEQLKAGKKTESDLMPSDLFSEKELKEGGRGAVYLAAVVLRNSVQPTKNGKSKRGLDPFLPRLILAGMERLQQIAILNPGLSNIFALEYVETDGTKPATNLLNGFGFQLAGKSKEGYSAYNLSLPQCYRNMENIFTAVAEAREKHIQQLRHKKKKTTVAISISVVIAASMILAKMLGAPKSSFVELGLGFIANALWYVAQLFLPAKSS